MKVGGRGGEGRKRLQTNPSILKTCVRQRTQRLIGSASQTMWTCVDQRFVSYCEDGMVRDTWSARFALQGKSIFLASLILKEALLVTKYGFQVV